MKNRMHQIKSSWYYIFWGLMSASVVAGQIYVGTGYREMSESIKSVIQIDPPSNSQRMR
jgi:hypothetical protein|tara:strand:+ start:303 stop:479 length:177 start_codon:yes stop_codon:yes gene_type:complete